MSEEFREPRIGISKVYTRSGDDGTTALVGGQRVPKDDIRIEAYGGVDELNSIVGLARAEIQALGTDAEADHDALDALDAHLLRVQHALFNLGSVLATLPADVGPAQPRIRDEDVARLEAAMDEATGRLEPLQSFVLPGGSRLNAVLHLARTVARRVERTVVRLRREDGCEAVDVHYLNRLSDAFFVWAREAARAFGHDEVLWRPNKSQ